MATFNELQNLAEVNKQWYFTTYPFLKDIVFPPPIDFLKAYYETDMLNRNLTPLTPLFDNYEFLFSFFLENFPKDRNNKFVAPDWFDSLLRAFPIAIKQTGTDLSNFGKDISDFFGKFTIILLIGLALIAVIMVSKG